MRSKTILFLAAIAAIILLTNTPGVKSDRSSLARKPECDDQCKPGYGDVRKCCKGLGCYADGCSPVVGNRIGAFCNCKVKPMDGRKDACDRVCDGTGNEAEVARLEQCCKDVAKCKGKKGCYDKPPEPGFSAYCEC